MANPNLMNLPIGRGRILKQRELILAALPSEPTEKTKEPRIDLNAVHTLVKKMKVLNGSWPGQRVVGKKTPLINMELFSLYCVRRRLDELENVASHLQKWFF